MMRKLLSILLAAVVCGFIVWQIASCQESPRLPGKPQTGLPTCTMKLGGRSFTLEIAATDARRQKGLMFRQSMPADHGMIFVYAEADALPFWMKNTYIPLDIVYVGADQRIVSIHQLIPHDETGVYSKGPARWAIELNKDTASKLGLKPGDLLDIPASAARSLD